MFTSLTNLWTALQVPALYSYYAVYVALSWMTINKTTNIKEDSIAACDNRMFGNIQLIYGYWHFTMLIAHILRHFDSIAALDSEIIRNNNYFY